MNKETDEFIINAYRVSLIEKIAKDNTTIFRNFDDFVEEAIGTYILWWTDPVESKKALDATLPHLRPEQLEFMKELVSDELYQKLTKEIAVKKKQLKTLPFEPLPESGLQRFHLDRLSHTAIEEIIASENVGKKLNSVKAFVEYAIEFFIKWWMEPEKAIELQYDVWPYIPTEIKDHWRNDPDWKSSFDEFEKRARDWNQKQGNDLRDISDETETVNHEIKQTRQNEEFSIENEKPTMQIASSEGGKSFIDLCKRMNETKRFLTEEAFSFRLPPEHAKEANSNKNFGPVNHLPYDEYPLIWQFYTRMLPVKILVAVLADMTKEKRRETVDYKEFRERGYYAALGLAEKLSDWEKKYNIKRNEKRSTGFPISPIDTLGKLDNEKMRKFVTSKQRFQEYFIGMKRESWVKRQKAGVEGKVDRGLAFFDGALNAMGLVYVQAYNNGKLPELDKRKNEFIFEYNEKEDFSIEIGLTQRGLDFYLKENPIFRDYEDMWWPKVFSKEESEFILNEIIPDFPLEHEFVKKIMDTLSKSKKEYVSASEIDEKLDVVVIEWLQKNKKHRSHKELAKFQSDEGKIIGIGTWRARTMARLAEMNQIEWSIEKKTSKPLYKIKEEPTLKLRKKKVVQTSKSK